MTAEPTGSLVTIGTTGLKAGEVVDVARDAVRVEISAEAIASMDRARALVVAAGQLSDPVYGVSTGFGLLATTRIEADRRSDLQHALIRSHAAGMGDPVEAEVVRAMMLLRARTLCMGFSGSRPEVAQRLIDLLNAGITPIVPEHGSLGASGDLAPLAHMSLVLLGEGRAQLPDGRAVGGGEALEECGLEPLRLEVKDGLSLINGTDGMLGMLVLALADLAVLLPTAEIAAALSTEGLMGTDRPFAADLHAIRPHPGQIQSAANLRRMLHGSAVLASHRSSPHLVQDPYSIRCAPQVVGAARDTTEFARQVADRELRSAVDNPVVLPDGRLESTGNFHGEPLAFACDFLSIAAAEVASIAERRVDRILDPTRSAGLPPFLAPDAGVNSGLMIAQYTAAAMVAENRRLASPASVDSIPTSGMQEDHVSMGWGAARKLRQVVVNLSRVLAVELLAASRALELRAPLEPSPADAAVAELVRQLGGGVGPDSFVSPQLEAVAAAVRSGEILRQAESVVGELT
ncbi:MAG TPA: histidine ammonia-lyase [Candidatus Dormibacteraeota bacterium]|nr:histidine ammonia-lyase [Candidatus Dormibacteraeota bacterium]